MEKKTKLNLRLNIWAAMGATKCVIDSKVFNQKSSTVIWNPFIILIMKNCGGRNVKKSREMKRERKSGMMRG